MNGRTGQFERTLIIADEGAQAHYVEGCTAPIYTTDSFHSGVIEIVVKKRAPLALHHHPELVEQYVQPGDPAGDRARKRHHGMGGRQPGLQADHEVPLLLPGGPGRAWRDPLDGVCRPASTRIRVAR
jgi:hypothetical protein